MRFLTVPLLNRLRVEGRNAARDLSGIRTRHESGHVALPQPIETIRTRALNGHVLEQVQWGDILLDSVHVPRNPDRARQWFAIAASAGYAPAHNMLGRCHHFGWGCPIDLARAVKSYETAARLGDSWGRYNLGIMLMRGLGVQSDLVRALAQFRSAAASGHAKSMNLVARFTEEGWATPRDPILACDWYRRSAEAGDYRGQHNYATYLVDQGHMAEALMWWRRALTAATSDILFAMHRHLSRLGSQGDAALLADVQTRIAALPAAAKKEANTQDTSPA